MDFEDMDEFDETPEPKTKYVLGLDPGGTTGVALLSYTDETAPELIYLHQITDGHRGFYGFFYGSRSQNNLTQVSEKWVEGGVKGANHEPLIIEGVEYAIWEDDIEWQTPDMKSLVPDSWLKEQNLWTPGRRHQMDALIHALVYLRNSGHKPTIEALSNRAEKPIAEEGEAKAKELGDQAEGGMTPEEAEEIAEMMQALAEAMAEEEPGEGEGTGEGTGEGEGDGEGLEEGEGAGGEGAGGEAEQRAGAPEPGTGAGGNKSVIYNEAEEHPDFSKFGAGLGIDNTIKGDRRKRSLNGVFVGFEADGDDGELLFDEKL